jgi:O-antigen/teichoic acid export membrane protein
MSAQIINMLSTNMDNILVGKYFGITNLGYYTLAWDLALKPVYAIIPMLMKVKMPIWAKLKQEKAILLEDFKQTIFRISLPLILLYLIAYFLTPYFIPFWYGEKWLPSVAFLQILIFIGMTRCIGSITNTLALTLGFFRAEFYINCFQLACYLILLPISIYFFNDLNIFCWMMVLGYAAIDMIWYVFLWKKYTSASFFK